MKQFTTKFLYISTASQKAACFDNNKLWRIYPVSSGKNGVGEQQGSEKTPRGWHQIHKKIGIDSAVNSVFVGRKWTGEIYDATLAAKHPDRDWILTRILQLDGLEPGRNKGGDVDSLQRYIYIHGTPEATPMGIPGSHGCIRMRNQDVMELADWITIGTGVFIEG